MQSGRRCDGYVMHEMEASDAGWIKVHVSDACDGGGGLNNVYLCILHMYGRTLDQILLLTLPCLISLLRSARIRKLVFLT